MKFSGRLGEDQFLKVKFSSEASGCSLRARIIGRLHKITASELNKRTIKHIFITHEYFKFKFPNPGCHICFYLCEADILKYLGTLMRTKVCIFPTQMAVRGPNCLCCWNTTQFVSHDLCYVRVRTVCDLWRRYSI